MSAVYDNWERLVAAVLKKEQLWQLFHEQSRSPSITSSSSSSDFSFSRLNSSLDDVPFGFFSPKWSAAPTHSRKRDLTIQVPKPGIEDRGFSSAPENSEYCPKVNPALSSRVNRDDAKQESYPLPLPPAAISNSSHVSPLNSAAKLPSPPSCGPQGAENVKSPRTSWKKGKLIGRSPSGDVYIGFNSEKGQMCAMKEINLSSKDAVSKQNAKILEKQIALLCRTNHPCIVQYYGSEMAAGNFYLYFEYASGGSIDMILQQYGRFGESVIRSYTQQILSGLAYLHSKSIVHRDIKGANVLVYPNGRAKLCNFAMENHISEQSRKSWVMDSFYWMAPEVIMNPNACELNVDIWSLGCIVLEMATSRPPLSQYDRGVAMFNIGNHKELHQFPDHLSDVCKDFLRHCLQWNPLYRATASQLLEHPFVKSSWPLGKQILISSSSDHPASTKAIKSKGTDHARSPHQLKSGKVVFRKSNVQPSDIYNLRSISAPVSPVGSPLLHPMSPRHLNRRMPLPPNGSPHTSPKPMNCGIGTIPHPHLSQSTLRPETSSNLLNRSPKIDTPSYWDPNILRGVFRFS